jgi:hypothetical protein
LPSPISGLTSHTARWRTMQASKDSRRRLAVRLMSAAVLLAMISALGARWLAPREQDWLVVSCTVAAVLAGASLFWLTDSRLGWVGAAGLLLAVTPLVAHHTASALILDSRGRLDRCVVTSVEAQPGPTDMLPSIRYHHRLACAASGEQVLESSRPAAQRGESLAVWVYDRRAAVVAETRSGAGAPSPALSVLLAIAVVAALVLSGLVAVRRPMPRATRPA